jgi:hypothetical protein
MLNAAGEMKRMTLAEATKVGHLFGGLCAVADFNLDLH